MSSTIPRTPGRFARPRDRRRGDGARRVFVRQADDEPIATAGLAAFEQHGTALLAGADAQRLAAFVFSERGGLRPDAVGLSALKIGERIGVRVPPKTRVLGVVLERTGDDERLSKEILGPVLSFLSRRGRRCRVRTLPLHSCARR